MAMMPTSINVYTRKRQFTTTGVMKTLRQAASDPNNEWKVERVLVLTTETPQQSPPGPNEIATMVPLADLVGLCVVAGGPKV